MFIEIQDHQQGSYRQGISAASGLSMLWMHMKLIHNHLQYFEVLLAETKGRH